jgi:hypothetical protein
MSLRPEFLADLRRNEGLRLEAYPDPGKRLGRRLPCRGG